MCRKQDDERTMGSAHSKVLLQVQSWGMGPWLADLGVQQRVLTSGDGESSFISLCMPD